MSESTLPLPRRTGGDCRVLPGSGGTGVMFRVAAAQRNERRVCADRAIGLAFGTAGRPELKADESRDAARIAVAALLETTKRIGRASILGEEIGASVSLTDRNKNLRKNDAFWR